MINFSTVSCQKSIFLLFSKANRHSFSNNFLSHWALGLHMAGPLLLLSILNWIEEASVIIPDIPPRASISLIIWPFATPPIAGLQDILAIVSRFWVMSKTFDPKVAAAWAASQPACPPPTTITSYLSSKII